MHTKQGKDETCVSYLTRMSQIKDELVAIGDTVAEKKLVKIALNGFSKEWEIIVKVVIG